MNSVTVEELWKITRKISQCRWFVDWDSNLGHPQYQECLQLRHTIQFEALIVIVHSNRYVPSTPERNGCSGADQIHVDRNRIHWWNHISVVMDHWFH